MAALASTSSANVGGYAKFFTPVPEDWTLDGGSTSDGLIDLREDLAPDAHAAWLDARGAYPANR